MRHHPGFFATIVLASLLLFASRPAWADGPFSPENADETWGNLKFRCSIAFICPVNPDVWNAFRQSMAKNPADQWLLGIYLITGDKVGRDERGGQLWFGIAAQQGYARAALELNSLRHGGADMIVDETAIAAAMRTKADAGDTDAMRALSDMTMAGRGVERDPKRALDLLRRAAETGSGEAEHDLASLLRDGAPGVPKDIPEALRWMARSGGHGDVSAMLALSYMFLTGSAGVDQRIGEGYLWLMRAALIDDAEAQERLSQLLVSGKNTEGRSLWTPYDSIIGRPEGRLVAIAPDLVEADKWFRLAARSPWHDNPSIRQMIEPRMTSAQLKEAQARVAAWHKLKLEEAMALDIEPPATPTDSGKQ
jgi:TPR repeat protein